MELSLKSEQTQWQKKIDAAQEAATKEIRLDRLAQVFRKERVNAATYLLGDVENLIITFTGIDGCREDEYGKSEVAADEAEAQFNRTKQFLAEKGIHCDVSVAHDTVNRTRAEYIKGQWAVPLGFDVGRFEEEELDRKQAAGDYDYPQETDYSVKRSVYTIAVKADDIQKLVSPQVHGLK